MTVTGRTLRRCRFFRYFSIHLCGLVISDLGCFSLFRADVVLFCIPANFDGFGTPLRTAMAGSDRLIGDLDKHRIRVDRWQDPDGHPRRLGDFNGNRQRLDVTIGGQLTRRHDFAIDDDFDGNLSSVVDSATFQVPVRLVVQSAIANGLCQLVGVSSSSAVASKVTSTVFGASSRSSLSSTVRVPRRRQPFTLKSRMWLKPSPQ